MLSFENKWTQIHWIFNKHVIKTVTNYEFYFHSFTKERTITLKKIENFLSSFCKGHTEWQCYKLLKFIYHFSLHSSMRNENYFMNYDKNVFNFLFFANRLYNWRTYFEMDNIVMEIFDIIRMGTLIVFNYFQRSPFYLNTGWFSQIITG